MSMIVTHYDNLRVARNAPLEVIRAAYKTLSQKYHPDRNPGDPEAARIMAILNASYDVLSNPEKRAAHDRWLAQQELFATQAESRSTQTSAAARSTTAARPSKFSHAFIGVLSHLLRNWFWYGMVGPFAWIAFFYAPSPPPRGPMSYQVTPPASQPEPSQGTPLARPPKPAYERPNAAPNGELWPATTAYVNGYKRLRTSGLSTVTIDNSQNDSDVFVKLVSLNNPKGYPVRNVFISAHGTFTMHKVTMGRYDVRYRDLNTGALFRSEAFNLSETLTQRGTQFSNITMTIYKVQHRNLRTYPLSEEEF